MRWMNAFILLHACMHVSLAYVCAQEKSDSIFAEMDEVIVSMSKWEQDRDEIPNRIEKISMRDARLRNPQTTADMLSQSGAVFVQKSQQGGGSPMIRGFATNRVLLVVDGVRMNNAIYRSGNLQNIISIDPHALEMAEVVLGPGSLIYGSDAIGGVMDFHTLKPAFTDSHRYALSANAMVRFATANNERTVHADLRYAGKRWAGLTSFSQSSFGDLRMGSRGGPDSYLRKEYVERVNDEDRIIQNLSTRVQRFSGYEQLNVLQKLSMRTGEQAEMEYAFTYAGTGTVPRYDRLLQYRSGQPRFAVWDYGPMIWRMHTLTYKHHRQNSFYDGARYVAAIQDYDESRIERTMHSLQRIIQSEKVRALNLNWDAYKKRNETTINYGFEAVSNKVGSKGISQQIRTGAEQPFQSRYPNGSQWATTGIYASIKNKVGSKWIFLAGLRYAYNWLQASFDTSFFRFPFKEAAIRDGGLTGNAGMIYKPAKRWKVTGSLSTGYRMPNVDDVGKLFESVPRLITVPNPGLRSEYAWNLEAGLEYEKPGSIRLEMSGFHTWLDHAIVRRPATFNGSDSILYAGVMSRVEALQNVSMARVWGWQFASRVKLSKSILWTTHANWIKGIEMDDQLNTQVPLRHAPPFHASSEIRIRKNKYTIELSGIYQASVSHKDLPPSEALKTEIYAKDALGRPYCPEWFAVNLRAEYAFNAQSTLVIGLENITDKQYRPYASGIVAPGRQLVVSLRCGFKKGK